MRTPPAEPLPESCLFLATAHTGWRAFIMLSAPFHDRQSRLSCSLSGGRLPLDNLHGPMAAEGAAAAPRAAARLSRAMSADGVCGRGRVGRRRGSDESARCGHRGRRGECGHGRGVTGGGRGAGRRLPRDARGERG